MNDEPDPDSVRLAAQAIMDRALREIAALVPPTPPSSDSPTDDAAPTLGGKVPERHVALDRWIKKPAFEEVALAPVPTSSSSTAPVVEKQEVQRPYLGARVEGASNYSHPIPASDDEPCEDPSQLRPPPPRVKPPPRPITPKKLLVDEARFVPSGARQSRG